MKQNLESTISQTDTRFFGVDVEKDAFISDFTLGCQANQAADV